MTIIVPTVRLERDKDPRFQPHVLVLTDPGDGLEKEWEIEHPEACPRKCWWFPDAARVVAEERLREAEGGIPLGRVDELDCYVQHEVVNVGIDSLDIYALDGDDHLDPDYVPASRFEADWHRLRPGRYLVEGWYTAGISTPNGPAEPDGGLTLTGRA